MDRAQTARSDIAAAGELPIRSFVPPITRYKSLALGRIRARADLLGTDRGQDDKGLDTDADLPALRSPPAPDTMQGTCG